MARLPYLNGDDLAPGDRELLDPPINLARILAHSPSGTRAFRRLGGWIRFKARFDLRLREMAILRVGVVTRTDYEYSHHIELGRHFGLGRRHPGRHRGAGRRIAHGTRTARAHRH